MLQTIRNWQRRSVLRTSSVVLAVWLNLAFQVCAMASAPADDCPHCPLGMHDGEMPSMPMGCALLDPVDDPDLVNPVVKVPDLSGDFNAIASESWLLPQAPAATALKWSLQEPFLPFHGPPTHVLFCVYLN